VGRPTETPIWGSSRDGSTHRSGWVGSVLVGRVRLGRVIFTLLSRVTMAILEVDISAVR